MKIFRKKIKKKFWIISAVLLIGIIALYIYFSKGGNENLKLATVSRGMVSNEVSETGAVRISERIDLNFKNSGRIESVFIKVGDRVESGGELAKIDPRQINIELSEAQANLDVAVADYNRLLAGYSFEEIEVSSTQLANAQVSLRNAQQNLEDIKIEAEDNLNDSYEDAIDDLEDAKLKVYNASNVAAEIKLTYFPYNDQEGFAVNSAKEAIESAHNEIALATLNLKHNDFQGIDLALASVKNNLSDVSLNLETIRTVSESAKYKNSVSSASKTSLDNQKSYIVTAKSNIANAQQAISTAKISNEKAINTAKSNIDLAQSNVDIAQNQLLLKKAGPTEESRSLYLAKVNQAKANFLLLQNRLDESVLRSPVAGQVVEINKKAGETIQPSDYVISILPSGPFEVEVDIYEEDIVGIKEGNPVEINIPAFPKRAFRGVVSMIDPAEKIIDGVVYYKVIISFEESIEGIKPGMTADVDIETQKKENVIVVPRQALKRRNGGYVVVVLEGGKAKEREAEIGIVGEENAEIISGVAEGDQVVLESF